MSQLSISTSAAPNVIIDTIGGNLQVKGWDRNEILLRAKESDHPLLEEREGHIHVACEGDCIVRLPEVSSLQIQHVSGDTRVKMLEGPLAVEVVDGSLALRDTAQVQVSNVHGNFLSRQVDGSLRVQQVHGNAMARDIQGDCLLQQVGGNLQVRDAEGSVQATAGGNADLQLCLLTGAAYTISAGGNIACRVPDDADALITLNSGGQDIFIRLPDEKETYRSSTHSLKLGSGKAAVSLSAGGKVHFSSEEVSWSDTDDIRNEFDGAFSGYAEEISQRFAEQLDEQIESQMKILDEQMENLGAVTQKAGLSASEAERILANARSASDRATAQVQEKMQRAQEKLDRKLASAQRKVELRARAAERRAHEHRKRSWNFEWTSPPTQPRAPEHTVSDEERLIILRMLEQKKITLNQAEELLAALEQDTV